MPNYKKMYFELFNALTDAVRQIELGQIAAARKTLIQAQQNTEEMYLTESDDESPE